MNKLFQFTSDEWTGHETNVDIFSSTPQLIQSALSENEKMAEVLLVDHEIKLVWEDRCNVFAWGFEQLFTGGLQFDVTLQIGDKQLNAHRHILSFCSKFYRRNSIDGHSRNAFVSEFSVDFQDFGC